MTEREMEVETPFTVIGAHGLKRTVAICQAERKTVLNSSKNVRVSLHARSIHAYAHAAGESAHVAPG